MIAEFNRLVVHQIALENFTVAIARALQRDVPAFAQSLRQMEQAGEQEYRLMSLPGFAPEQADALTADYLEKWQQLLREARLPRSA